MQKAIVFAVLFTGILIIGGISPVFGAQLDARLAPDAGEAKITINYQRTVNLKYSDGGEIADLLRGTNERLQFTADSSDPGVQELIKKLNDKIALDGSSARITDLVVDYSAQITGRPLDTSVDYKIILRPTLSFWQIRAFSPGSPALIDAQWRGLTVQGPVVIQGKEINFPISAFSELTPGVFDKLQGTGAEALLSKPLIDAEGIKNQPLRNWHFLFDPTGINIDASTFGLSQEISGFVVSSYTMGESSIREGRQVEKIEEFSFTTDKKYDLRSIQSADSAEIDLIGFAAIDNLYGAEVFGVSPRAPEGAGTTSTGEFPVMIIYGMAGLAAVGAVAIMFMSSRKLKQEEGLGQQGIDPSLLRAVDTSAASGGYKTVRGEAQLRDAVEYEQTRSVYEEERKDEGTSSGKSRGSMPKGWKPS